MRTRAIHARLGGVLVAAVLAAGVLPAGASAATLAIGGNGDLVHQGKGEEDNVVTVSQVAGALVVKDTAGLSNIFIPVGDPRPRCVQVDRQTMRCPTRAGSRTIIRRFEARMNNGDDVAGPMDTHLPVEINGEEGNDIYRAFNPSFLTNVEFVGGSDFDSVSYAGSGGAAGGRGVRTTNDGLPNDGRPGLDTDNVGRDVEGIVGSSLPDEITTNGAPDILANVNVGVFVRSGQGDDVLRAGTGRRVVFEMGKAPDGADTIIGGSAISEVDYSERTRPVTATLNHDGADDGEAGERDQLLGGHEKLFGGQAGDTLRAPFGSTAAHFISGNAGNDQIDGADGADTLTGGPGGDSIRAFGGDDRLLLKDGVLDTLSCGDGTDTFEVDPIDNFGGLAPLCENGTVGVLRLAPKALRVKAGQPARVALSWRHPRARRQLRRVTLRLYRGDARVGHVAIRPRSDLVTAHGALRLVRTDTRLAHQGKTVSARLVLRLDRSLAGRRLRLEVEAVDRDGARQRERDAGSIRVAR